MNFGKWGKPWFKFGKPWFKFGKPWFGKWPWWGI